MMSLQSTSHNPKPGVGVEERARQAVWDNIAQLQLQIVEQKRVLNRMTCISRLNADVLLEIFIQYALSSMFGDWEDDDADEEDEVDDDGEGGKWKSPDWKTYRWLWVTHVCHHWRTVALDSPRLWSHFRLKNSAPLMRVMFERSKRALLRIEMEERPGLRKVEVLDLVTKNLDRTQMLTLKIDDSSLKPSISVPASAPHLTHYTFTPAYARENTPILFEQCHMPRLSYFKLNKAFVSWKSPILKKSLTHLIITQPRDANRDPYDSPPPPPNATIIEALGNMPLLEHLELESFSALFHIPADRDSMLRLPKLRTLKLTDKAIECGSFIRHTVHPITTRFAINITFDNSITREYQEFSEAIAPTLNTIRPQDVRSVVFTHSFGNNLRMALFPPEETLADLAAEGRWLYDFNREPLLDIAVKYPRYYRHGHELATVFVSICGLLSLSWVEKLHIDTAPAEMSEWMSVTSPLVNVRELVIRPAHKGWSVPKYLATRHTGEYATPNKSIAPIFPKLQVLMLSGARFRADRSCLDDGSEADAYRRMFAKRKDAGYMVEELILYECLNVTPRDVEKLQGVVGKVTWEPAKVVWTEPPAISGLPGPASGREASKAGPKKAGPSRAKCCWLTPA